MKKQPKTTLVDKMHRGVVITCIGLTLYGCTLLGNHFYHYFTVVKPARALEDAKLLKEGAPPRDNAPELRA